MKMLYIVRTSPTTGQVYTRYPYDEDVPQTGIMNFQDAKNYLDRNQKELNVYKVGITPKGGKRKLYRRILATDTPEAIGLFQRMIANYITEKKDVTYELLTGDWKPVCNKIIF